MNHNQSTLRISGMRIWPFKFTFLFFVFNLLIFSNLKAQQFKNEEELRKEAERLFEDDDFTKAYNLYAQLVSNYPKDPELNYRLGVCMLYSEPNKKKCFSYLKIAANHPKDAPKDAVFYLGKAYHINYQFDEALKYYNDYKKIGSASQQKRLQVDKEINACINGKRLLATMSELVVINKKQLNESDYFRSYDLTSIGGKLVVKPEDFKTSYDKRKKDKSIVYIPRLGDKVYFSSYGDNSDNGRDIYYKTRLSDNNYSKPVKIPGINTEFDEDYPFLHPDGKTLFFSSKGHNSMGGYDIFKSTFNDETNSWSTPVNMEFPINSPDDDYLFVTDEEGKIAYFSTGRQSPPGKIDVLKVNTERKPMSIAVLKGTVLKENASQRLDSKITVKNMDNGQVVGTYFAKDNGDYYMELPNGGKFIFTVETPNIPTQSDKVVLPVATSLSPFKQSISYDNKVLKILNYFDTPPEDSNYLKYLELIEKKAKLDVNENEVKSNPVIDAVATNSTNANAVTTNNPTIVSDSNAGNVAANANNAANTNTVTPNKANLSNDQLLKIAKDDAKEASDEASKIKQDAWDANEIGVAKKIEADKLQKEADDAFANANAITDEKQKTEALEKATEIKMQADNATNVANTIINLAKNLESDAANKQKEADLNQQYATELEKVSKNKNNKEALAKLSDLQKQIDAISKEKKQSDEAYTNIKSASDQKQTEITKAEEKSVAIKNEISEINKEISINETEINNTRDKSIKKNLTGQNAELKTDIDKKNTELTANEKLIAKLKDESASIQNQMDIVNTIKTTDSKTAVAANNTNPAANNTATTNISANTNTTAPANTLSIESVTAKYNDKLQPIQNTNDKNEYVKENSVLNDYNKELDNLIALNRVDIKAAANNNEKQKIINEISKLEKQKGINEEKITANNAKIQQLDGGTAVAATNTVSNTSNPINNNNAANNNAGNNINTANNNAATTNYQPIDLTFNGTDDNNKLIALKNQVDNTGNPAFAYNDYKDANSLNLKKTAEEKLQIANTTKTDLLTSITKAEESIKSSSGTPLTGPSKDKLNEEGDDLSGKAKDLRNQAQNKSGDEKKKLLDDARNLDAQANKKYLEATEVTKTQNKNEFSINNENIDNLIKTGKSPSSDADEAKKLNTEANTAFKQATAIRTEANGLGSDAAKLGTISNAEEKEAEAIAKQLKAIELLMKSNAGFELKKAEGAAPDNTLVLNNVKQQNEKFNKDKMDAYMALSKANQNEYKTLSPKIKASNAESSRLKKEAESLNTQALALISKALTESDAGAKQNLLLEANKKEVEALSALNKAEEASKSTAIAANNNNAGNNNVTPIDNNAGNNNNAGNDNNTKTNTANTNTTAVATNTPEANVSGNNIAVENNNAGNNNAVATNTTAANNSAGNNNAVTTNTTAANNNTENNNAVASKTETPVSTATPDELKTKIDNLGTEADTYATEAVNLRKEAADKTDPEKTNLTNKAKELESKSINTKLQASSLQKDLNEAQYTNLNEAIANYIEKAKAKNAPELANAEELVSMINNNKKQANDIRNEANSTGNNAAKLGVISNAEEKEAEIQLRQYDVINMLKKYDDSYAVKTPVVNITNTEAKTTPTVAANNNAGNNNVAANNNNTAGNNNVAANNNTNPRNNANNNAGNNNVAANNTNPRNNANNNAGNNNVAANNTNPRNNANNNAENNTGRNNANNNVADNTNITTNANAVPFKAAGVEVKTTNAYSANNPIPVDAKIPEGLIFRVQIGAFKAPVPNNSFGGLTPVNAETTTNGYIRYTAGNFDKFEDANAVKNDLRNLGYQDAFVVGFYEGRRVSINEAITLLQKEGKEVNLSPNVSAGITANNNIPKNTVVAPTVNAGGAPINTEPAVVTKELEQINGLLFTVQIGVYSRQVTRGQLYNLSPIFTEKLPSGLYRYTAGIYNVKDHLSTDRARVNGIGIKDAFSSAYYNGKRVTFTQAEQIKNDSVNLKMEPENPIVFPAVADVAPTNNTAAGVITPTVTPFSNGVTTGPAPTAENGVKVGEEGLSFKVQIGAYRNQVPAEIAANFQKIKEWPVDNKLINALYIYTVGNFTDVKFAKQLKDQMIGLGIGDAFVSVYQNGKKLSYAEAAQYLNR